MSQIPTQQLPPLETSGVLALSASTIIDVPRSVVWDVLTDFKSYPEWNPFTQVNTNNSLTRRSHYVIDHTGSRVPDDAITEGLFLDIPEVYAPPTMGEATGYFQRTSSFELVTVFDKINHRFAWRVARFPGWLLRTERWQVLTDEGNGQTRYYSVEVIGGIMAYLVKLRRSALEAGFQAMADSLKTRAEEVKLVLEK